MCIILYVVGMYVVGKVMVSRWRMDEGVVDVVYGYGYGVWVWCMAVVAVWCRSGGVEVVVVVWCGGGGLSRG